MHYALGPNACVVNFAARILVTSKGRVDLWAEVVKDEMDSDTNWVEDDVQPRLCALSKCAAINVSRMHVQMQRTSLLHVFVRIHLTDSTVGHLLCYTYITKHICKNGQNLYAISEFAQELIKACVQARSRSLQSYQRKVKVPSDTVRALPNPEAATKVMAIHISKTVCLPEETLAWLLESSKTQKPASASKFQSHGTYERCGAVTAGDS
ncbi:hypothetical protein BD769DRAFT_1389648 [Suillus cothurnatus]|nr:hypothetical protein BD769DRAFT_1389648 [Suillus cothurnatus]